MREYAAALMRVTLGGFWGFTRGTGFGISRQGLEVLEVVPMMGVSQQMVSSCIHAETVAGKRCCPIPSQLRDCSG